MSTTTGSLLSVHLDLREEAVLHIVLLVGILTFTMWVDFYTKKIISGQLLQAKLEYERKADMCKSAVRLTLLMLKLG